VSFDLIEWKLCFVSVNVIMGQRTTIGSIKYGFLAHLSIKSFYARLNVMEIDIYHQTHTRTNGDLAHNACPPRFTSWMLVYAPHASHKLKEFIWTQLGLKQIYDKHKEIWWAQMWVNGWPRMIFTIPRYCLLGLEAQEGHFTFAQKFNTFDLIMGLCSS
jgi:hypothetical protein